MLTWRFDEILYLAVYICIYKYFYILKELCENKALFLIYSKKKGRQVYESI